MNNISSKDRRAVPLGSAGQVYGKLEGDRQQYLDKAQQMAAVTLPYECPPDEGQAILQTRMYRRQELPVPKNGLGPQGVKNLASKLVTSLFPSHIPFFRFAISESVLDEADQMEQEAGEGQQFDDQGVLVQAGGSFRSTIQKQLLSHEKTVAERTERFSHRKTLYNLMKKLIITGNALLRFLEDGSLKIHNLGTYVVERDYGGKPFRIILKEMKMVDLLDEVTKEKVLVAKPDLRGKDDAEVDLFTYWGKQESGALWETWQEVSSSGIILPDSYGTMKWEDLPVMAERWIAVDGENYGRSLCEEHESDLLDLESLTTDVKETSKSAARIIPLVNPNGITDAQALAEAENLEFVDGVAEDVTAMSLIDKVNDYQAANTMIATISRRLQEIFLMYQAAQRDAERVTAAEVRYIVSQLEGSHGGVHTVLADELQRPYVHRMIQQSIKDGELDKELFTTGDIKPDVITGIDALGRGQDVEVIRDLFAMINENQAQQDFHMPELWTRYLVATGQELDGLLKTPDDKVQEQNQMRNMQQNQMQQGVGAEMAVNEHMAGLKATGNNDEPPA